MDLSQFIENLLAVIATILNGIPQGLLSLSIGFASVPTGLAFLVGAAACGITGSVVPVSFQAETIVLAGQVGKEKRERISMIILAAVLTLVLGLTGAMSWLMDFSGTTILNAMMAGVGFMLARVSLEYTKTNRLVTISSIATALVVYFFFTTDLVWIVIVSMFVSTIISHLAKQRINAQIAEEKPWSLKLVKPQFNLRILRGALALACMTIGGNIAYGSVTASMTNLELLVDELTVYSGLADVVSSMFGGMSLEAIISATATAPNPIFAAVAFQVIMGLILLFGLLPKIGKFVPGESIAGFLFVLGSFVALPGNAQVAFNGTEPGAPIIAATTLVVTAAFDPFTGIVAGIVIRALFGLGFGM